MPQAPRPAAATAGPSPAKHPDGWEAAFWLVFQRTANPIVLLDTSQRVLEVNDPACALLETARGDLLGQLLRRRFAPEESEAATRDWQRLLRSGELVGKRVVVRPDGSRLEAEWAARVAEIGARPVVIAVLLHGSPLPEPRALGVSMSPLTPRESEVVTLIAMGLETPAIAARLHISAETVKSHVRNAMRKLRARTRAQLVTLALSNGQIAPLADLEQMSAYLV